MKSKPKKKIFIFLIIVIILLVFIIYQQNNKKTRIFELAKGNTYQELVEKDYIRKTTDDKSVIVNTPAYKFDLEDYYFDKNFLAFTIKIDYWNDEPEIVKPLVYFNNKYLHDCKYIGYGSDYLYLIPSKNLKDDDKLEVLLYNPKSCRCSKYFKVYKTVNDDELRDFELFDDGENKIADLSISPYGTVIKFDKDYEFDKKSNSFGLKINNDEEILDFCTLNYGYMILFNDKLKIPVDDLDKQKVTFNQYNIEQNNKVISSTEVYSIKKAD